MLTGRYQPGHSLLHRAPAGLKLLLLAASLVVVSVSGSFVVLAVVAAVVVALYWLCSLGLRALVAEVAPLRWFLLVLAPFQWVTLGWRQMVLTLGGLLVSVAAAGLLTRTTPVSALLATFARAARPLRLVGVDPDRVALTLSLAIRAIPVVRDLMEETGQARKARGLERSVQALVTPTVVRTVRHADRVGEALAARGFDD